MSKSEDWQRGTALIRSGINHDGHQETSESLFMTSGYIYETAEQAVAARRGDTSDFVYSRYRHPTLRALEERSTNLEGAEACSGN